MGPQAHHQFECLKVVLVFEVWCHSFNIVVRIDLVSVLSHAAWFGLAQLPVVREKSSDLPCFYETTKRKYVISPMYFVLNTWCFHGILVFVVFTHIKAIFLSYDKC